MAAAGVMPESSPVGVASSSLLPAGMATMPGAGAAEALFLSLSFSFVCLSFSFSVSLLFFSLSVCLLYLPLFLFLCVESTVGRWVGWSVCELVNGRWQWLMPRKGFPPWIPLLAFRVRRGSRRWVGLLQRRSHFLSLFLFRSLSVSVTLSVSFAR